MKIIFDSSPDLSSISLPLLVYHPTQIILGSALVPWLQRWVASTNNNHNNSNGGGGELQVVVSPTASQPGSRLNTPLLGGEV